MDYQFNPIPDRYNQPPPRRNTPVVAIALGCTLLGGLSGFGGAALYQHINPTEPTSIVYAAPSTTNTTSQVVSVIENKGYTLADLYADNVNSAVGITVSTVNTNFFGQPTSSAASGSGFVITADGYVVTNHHVIESATSNPDTPIEVSFQNGDRYDATLVGYEKDNDLAVLKINGSFTPVILGDSDTLVVGEIVCAIGNPLGELDFSFTDGVISAKERLISGDDNTTLNMLQTNVAINPGNSGGPLFDSNGTVIGINTAKYTNAQDGTTVEGLGFAIPINDVKNIIEDLIAYGYVTGKPYLGIVVENVPDNAQQYGIKAGASIVSVAQGGAADRAGLRAGDIIIKAGPHNVNSHTALTAAISDYRAGETIELLVVRNQEEISFSVVLDEKNNETTQNNAIPEETTQEPEVQINPFNPFAGLFP